jgi:hypothetical protein
MQCPCSSVDREVDDIRMFKQLVDPGNNVGILHGSEDSSSQCIPQVPVESTVGGPCGLPVELELLLENREELSGGFECV